MAPGQAQGPGSCRHQGGKKVASESTPVSKSWCRAVVQAAEPSVCLTMSSICSCLRVAATNQVTGFDRQAGEADKMAHARLNVAVRDTNWLSISGLPAANFDELGGVTCAISSREVGGKVWQLAQH